MSDSVREALDAGWKAYCEAPPKRDMGRSKVEAAILAALSANGGDAVEVTSDMIMAFHDALTDGPISENDFNEVKIGLTAALRNLNRPAPPSVAVPEEEIRSKILEELESELLQRRMQAGHKEEGTDHYGAAVMVIRDQIRILRTAGDDGEGV